jgi:hypothetical protein
VREVVKDSIEVHCPVLIKKQSTEWFVGVSRMSRERFDEFEDGHKFDGRVSFLCHISLLMLSIGYVCY